MPAVSNSLNTYIQLIIRLRIPVNWWGISGKFTDRKGIRIVQGWWSEVRDVALIFITNKPLLCSFAIFVPDALAGILWSSFCFVTGKWYRSLLNAYFVNIYCVSDYNSIVYASLAQSNFAKKNNCVLETCCTWTPFAPFQMHCIL